MSTATFDQLREEVLRLPPPIRLTLTTALMLEKEQRQKLLDENGHGNYRPFSACSGGDGFSRSSIADFT